MSQDIWRRVGGVFRTFDIRQSPQLRRGAAGSQGRGATDRTKAELDRDYDECLNQLFEPTFALHARRRAAPAGRRRFLHHRAGSALPNWPGALAPGRSIFSPSPDGRRGEGDKAPIGLARKNGSDLPDADKLQPVSANECEPNKPDGHDEHSHGDNLPSARRKLPYLHNLPIRTIIRGVRHERPNLSARPEFYRVGNVCSVIPAVGFQTLPRAYL